MHSYDPTGWSPFFVAMIGASAALTGLLFVAVSINLDSILKGGKFLTSRAAETLATLMLVVVSSALALVPQNTRLLGAEILAIATPFLVITTWRQLGHLRGHRDDPSLWSISRIAATAVATVPATVAGLSLTVRWGGGFY